MSIFREILKKRSALVLALISFLLMIVSVSTGAVNQYASINEQNYQNNSLLTNLQKTQFIDSSLNGQIGFLRNSSSFAAGTYQDPDASFVVNHTGDTFDNLVGDGICADAAGNCTLRAAIQEANAQFGNDVITFSFPITPVTIQLDSSLTPKELVISEGVTINGLGAGLLTVNGNPNTTSIFNITVAATASTNISDITISNSGGNGVNNDGNLKLNKVVVKSNGTGINNSGTLEINQSIVSNNTDSGIQISGASVATLKRVEVTGNTTTKNNSGAGISISGTSSVNIINSLIANNTTTKSSSNGGIYLSAGTTANVSNTTITNNTTAGSGGGIFSLTPNLTLNNVTISHNSATVSGGGLYYGGTTTGVNVRNTLIALNNSAAGPDIFSANGASVPTPAKFNSLGNNLIGTNIGDIGFVNGAKADKVGGVGASAIDPLLGPLQNNGGGINTRALLNSSPARDAGSSCVTNSSCTTNNPSVSLTIDQRGTDFLVIDFPRLYQTGVDIGAFESFYPVASISSFNPENWGAGAGAFILTINGSNFVADSVVKWNGAERVTTFVSNNQIKAQILASDVQTIGQYPVTVTNPQPGGGSSAPSNFTIANCSFSLNPTSINILSAGGNGSTDVVGINGCQWTATSNAPWLTISTGSGSGTGPGTVSFGVASNSGPARSGTLTIAGQTFTVNQASGCVFTLPSTSGTFPATAGTGSFNVNSANGCQWTATTTDSWITFVNSTGTGNGTVQFSLAANTGPQRTGTISVNGKTYTITQAGGCSYSISPTNANASVAGGAGTFNVSAGNGCQWTATSNNPDWITVNTGSGSGNGSVSYTVAANNGPARTGTITVNGQTFTITQANNCSFTINPLGQEFQASGGSSSFALTASNPGCSWTAAASDNWITVINSTGNGSQTINFSVAANNGPSRTGTITVGGKTFTITQNNGCTFTLTPSQTSINPAGGNGSFNVTASNQACTWTAVKSDIWITINTGNSGTGNGTVTYTVAANISPQRTGTITVNGQVFTITQENGCTYLLSPTNANVPASSGSGSFNVITGPGCQWTSTENETWVQITPVSGVGNGAVTYTFDANIGPLRTGIITVNGQTFTLVQANGCTYILAPNSANFSAAGGTGSFTVTPSDQRCTWTPVSNNPDWITVTAGSGPGTGNVQFTVSANISPLRNGTITVQGQTFTVIQENGCTYSINPTSVFINEAGGTSNFNVSAGPGCTWKAAPSETWITVTNPNNGNGVGSGTVAFLVSASDVSERIGTITVEGKIFTIRQLSLKVTSLNDSGNGSLRKAVSNANLMPGDDVVTFHPSVESGIITLTSGEIIVENNGALEIKGRGASKVRISGNYNSRIFLANNANFRVSDLTLMQGNGMGSNSSESYKRGGAIFVKDGSFKMNRVTVENNLIEVSGQTTLVSSGAGIFIEGGGPHLIENSTFNFNRCFYGAAIFNQNATVSILNSTITANTASMGGGGIYSTGQIILRNATIYKNTAPAGSGGGLYVNSTAVSMGNTIIAGNTGPEITNTQSEFVSAGSNLIGDAPGDAANTNKPIVYLPSDILDTPPKLADADEYGGETITHALYPGSPAINKGNNSLATSFDQRGAPRIVQGTADIGAYEYNIELTPTNPILPNASLNVYYTQHINAQRFDNANNPEFLYTIREDLPAGMRYFQDTGSITGTPTVNGTFTLTVKARDLDGMTGVNQYTLTISCPSSINPANQSFTAAGGTAVVNVTAETGCQWTAATTDPWINVTSGASGNGSNPVSMTIAPNTGAARTGTVLIAGKTFNVSQAASCAFTISPESQNVSAALGSYNFAVNTSNGCTWSATTTSNWITFTDNSGSGNGSVNFSVSANSGPQRSGTITVGGRTFTVIQANGCSYTLSAPNANLPSGGGARSFNINTAGSCAWNAVSSVNWITTTSSGSGPGAINYAVAANAGPARSGAITAGGQTFTVTQAGLTATARTAFDFDGDGKSDVSVFRPSDGNWYINRSSQGFTSVQFGAANDKVVPADYDGDGKTDPAVYRDGAWYLLRSQDGFTGVQFGTSTDIPVPADYDGDGKADLAVFRDGTWYLLQSTAGFTGINFGQANDKPVPADYDGDGKADQGVFRNGAWYLLRSRDGFTGASFGQTGDKPVPADFDGDGKADIAVYRDGAWYLLRSQEGFTGAQFGIATDKPVPADYDGDGKADIAVFRDGVWYLLQSTAGFTGVTFGQVNDKPVIGAYR